MWPRPDILLCFNYPGNRSGWDHRVYYYRLSSLLYCPVSPRLVGERFRDFYPHILGGFFWEQGESVFRTTYHEFLINWEWNTWSLLLLRCTHSALSFQSLLVFMLNIESYEIEISTDSFAAKKSSRSYVVTQFIHPFVPLFKWNSDELKQPAELQGVSEKNGRSNFSVSWVTRFFLHIYNNPFHADYETDLIAIPR